MDWIIKAEGLSKFIARERILQNIHLEIREGEFVALIGPSGSGKSSLLYLLGLLDEPSGGTLWLEGERINFADKTSLARLRRDKIGFVFQFHYLIPELTVLENVMLPLLHKGENFSTAKSKAQSLLHTLGLSGKENRPIYELSGGEMQRVSIARALSYNPKILLCDEPTGNLDSKNTLKVMELLAEINKEGTTILLVTHDLSLTRFAHRVIEILDGQIVKEYVPT